VTSTWIFLVSFFAMIAGCAIGMTLRVRLPKGYLNAENREMIRLCASLLATLAAALISLTIASAKTSYETQDAHFRQFAACLVEVDRLLAQYGPVLLFALSISTALFLVADLSRPFVGLMQLPREQLKHALGPLN
jgi:hypothetical protein